MRQPHTIAAIRDGRYAHISIAIAQRIKRLHAAVRDIDPVAAGVRPVDAARARTWAERRAAHARLHGLPAQHREPAQPADASEVSARAA